MEKLWIMVTAVVLMSVSCGSPKTVTAVKTTAPVEEEEKIIPTNPVEEYAEMLPDLRAVGQGDHIYMGDSRNLAEQSARNSFAATLKTKVFSAILRGGNTYNQAVGTQDGVKGVQEVDEVISSVMQNIVDEEVTNTVVVKSQKSRLKNGQYRTYVCIEYRGDRSGLAQNIANRIEKLIPEEERLKMLYERDSFLKNIQEELGKTASK